MWLITEYLCNTLFSLKPAYATSSGGRTLLVPTPFAFKMALVDVVCRTEGVRTAEVIWDWLRNCATAIRPARQVVVNNAFTRILKPRRNPAEAGSEDEGPFQRTIGYREYAFVDGPLGIALQPPSDEFVVRLAEWMVAVNYLGKRGGFVQAIAPAVQVETLPDGYVHIATTLPEIIPIGVMQKLDECGPTLTFAKANIFTSERILLHKDRILRDVVLPYRVKSSSRGYTWYVAADSQS